MCSAKRQTHENPMSEVAVFDAVSRLSEAKLLHREGRLDDAERLYRNVLAS
jgi:hypothetical protein